MTNAMLYAALHFRQMQSKSTLTWSRAFPHSRTDALRQTFA
jgi:hypothetical protein